MNNSNLEFEKYLNKPLKNILDVGFLELETNPLMEHSVYQKLKLNPKTLIFSTVCHSIQVRLSKEKIIKEIRLNFPNHIDTSGYNEMIEQYGTPSHILKSDKLLNEQKSKMTNKRYSQNLAKRNYSMKEVSFEDKPILIIWKKLGFNLEVRFEYEHKISQVVYKIVV